MDTDVIVKEVREWPQDQQINWSEVARKHNVPGKARPIALLALNLYSYSSMCMASKDCRVWQDADDE